METTYKKIENELEVSKVPEVVEPVVTKYKLDFLKEQELSILKSMNDFVEQRQKELAEVRTLIAEAEKLGLKTSEEIRSEKVIEEEKLLDIIN